MNRVEKVAEIGVEEFQKLLMEARAAFEHEDIETTLRINQRLYQVGYSLVVRQGTLHIQNETTPRVAEGY